jgi:sterol desaturase/sphingolipid hydroxylase (fatty acid hydroxylase superfamily)
MQWSLSIPEPMIRLLIFVGIFGAMALWELFDSWRHLNQGRTGRWPGNLGIFVLDIAVVRLFFPAAAVGFAVYAQASNFGLLPLLGLPPWLAGIAGFLLLDLLIYLQHRVFHHVPWLWRLHRMHHADTELDVTSGFRFHPLEILLSMLIKGAAIVALGISPLTVLVFETVLNGSSLFNHANIRLNPRFECVLRWIIVTPDMHRVHHSVERAETDSNFGFNLPWWDRLFGTHIPKPHAGFEAMTIGLHEFRDIAEQRLDRLVTQPFRAPKDS